MEARKKQLTKLVMELGSFFANCDGNFDERESKFLDGYVDKMVQLEQLPKEELEEIKNNLPTSFDIEYLIQETKRMRDVVTDLEKVPLLRTLSYFIHGMILADGVIHPNEKKYYTEWKDALELDDDINIDEYLKQD